jgi:four helix bundle protein
MATIERFEDLDVWKDARVLVKDMYALTDAGAFSKDFDLRSQIRRSTSSIMHNISEGFDFDAGSDAEFIRVLGIARRSASEARSQLYIALDQAYITDDQFDD